MKSKYIVLGVLVLLLGLALAACSSPPAPAPAQPWRPLHVLQRQPARNAHRHRKPRPAQNRWCRPSPTKLSGLAHPMPMQKLRLLSTGTRTIQPKFRHLAPSATARPACSTSWARTAQRLAR